MVHFCPTFPNKDMLTFYLRRYDYAAWNSAIHQSQNLAKIIEWQKKAFMLDLQIKGGDHEDTSKARKRLEELTRRNIAKKKELQI
jgi:hypothetical protein